MITRPEECNHSFVSSDEDGNIVCALCDTILSYSVNTGLWDWRYKRMKLRTICFTLVGTLGAIGVLSTNLEWSQTIIIGFLGGYFGYDMSIHLDKRRND